MRSTPVVLLWLLLQPVFISANPVWPPPSEGTCIKVYLEADYSLFLEKGSMEEAELYVRGLFQQVAAFYEQEGILLQPAGFFFWEEPSPYTGKTNSVLLGQFQRHRRSFDGDLALLLSYNTREGMAVVDGLCRPDPGLRMAVAGILPSYAPFPEYSASVYSVAHQISHLIGLQHTNACVWNGEDAAIDASQGFTEGPCPLPSDSPAAGTLMYSCTPPASGIDFRLGLGQAPGDLLRKKIAAAAGCLSVCTTPEEEPDTSCVQQYYMELTLDRYASETTWELTTAAKGKLAGGGPYTNSAELVTVRDTFCLPEGCFSFTIRDIYGDGICCDFGEGRLLLYDDQGDTLAVVKQFGNAKKIDFCTAPAIQSPCASLRFDQANLMPHGEGLDQDQVDILDGGQGIRIGNHTWKAVPLDYELTSETMLTFEFRATTKGEFHAIGFDTGPTPTPELAFHLFGDTPWGIDDYRYYPGDGNWVAFTIPVGSYFTGRPDRLILATAGYGVSDFRRLRLFEGDDCTLPLISPAQKKTYSEMVLAPNPASSVLYITTHLPVEGRVRIQLRDLTGRLVQTSESYGYSGSWQTELKVDGLSPGIYIVHLEQTAFWQTKRLVISRPD